MMQQEKFWQKLQSLQKTIKWKLNFNVKEFSFLTEP